MSSKKYLYQLSDVRWRQIESLPLKKYHTGHPTRHHNRTMVNVLLYIDRSGAPWRDLPDYYPLWKSVYIKFCRSRDSGLLEKIFQTLNDDPDLENLMIDSTIVPAHQHSAGTKKRSIHKLDAAGG